MKPLPPIVVVFVALLAAQGAAQRTTRAASSPTKVCLGPPSWHDLNGGVSQGPVRAVGFFGPPSSRELIVGGSFTSAGGIGVSNIASWDGSSWSATNGWHSGLVYDLASTRGRLSVGGHISQAGGIAVGDVALWGCDSF